MLEVMMALGTYRFGLSSAAYDRLTRSAAWRWPTQERLGTYPVRQFIGPGDTTLRLEGVIHPHYKGLLGLPNLIGRVPLLAAGLGVVAGANSALSRVGLSVPGYGDRSGAWQLTAMMDDASKGIPLLLVDGRGRNWGYWCLLDLEESESHHLADGSSLMIRFSASLGFYGDDAPSSVSADTSLRGAISGLFG